MAYIRRGKWLVGRAARGGARSQEDSGFGVHVTDEGRVQVARAAAEASAIVGGCQGLISM